MPLKIKFFFTLFGLFYLCSCQTGVTGLPQSQVSTKPPLPSSAPTSALLPIPSVPAELYPLYPTPTPKPDFPSKTLAAPIPYPTILSSYLPQTPDIHEITGMIHNQNAPLYTDVKLTIKGGIWAGYSFKTRTRDGKYSFVLPLMEDKRVEIKVEHHDLFRPLRDPFWPYVTERELKAPQESQDIFLFFDSLPSCCPTEEYEDPIKKTFVFGKMTAPNGQPLDQVRIQIWGVKSTHLNEEGKLYFEQTFSKGIFLAARIPSLPVLVKAHWQDHIFTKELLVSESNGSISKNRVDFVFPSP